MSQLADLARPFPKQFVQQNPQGYGEYVSHHVVNQRLLQVVGPFNFGIAEVIRGNIPEQGQPGSQGYKPSLQQVIVGVVGRLSCAIDGGFVTIEEAGDCEQPRNWPHDGARLKDATSDAFKRCAMRIGLGLHLWSQADYYLYDRLKEAEHPSTEGEDSGEADIREDSGSAHHDAEEPSPESAQVAS